MEKSGRGISSISLLFFFSGCETIAIDLKLEDERETAEIMTDEKNSPSLTDIGKSEYENDLEKYLVIEQIY